MRGVIVMRRWSPAGRRVVGVRRGCGFGESFVESMGVRSERECAVDDVRRIVRWVQCGGCGEYVCGVDVVVIEGVKLGL